MTENQIRPMGEDDQFEYSEVWTRNTPVDSFRLHGRALKAKGRPWFTRNCHDMLHLAGVGVDAARARDLENLFNGSLSGFYYLNAASNSTETAAKWLLQAVASHLKETGQPFSRVRAVMPPDYLRAFVEQMSDGRVPANFSRQVFADMLDGGERNLACEDGPDLRLSGHDVVTAIVSDPKYVATGVGELDAIIQDIIAANPDNAARVVTEPKLLQWFTGQVMKVSKGRASAADVQAKLRSALLSSPSPST